MDSPVTLRPPFGLALCAATWLVCLVCLGALVATRSTHDVLGFGLLPVVAGYLVWMLFWAPAVVIGDRDVRLRNVARTHVVAWSAINGIETKYNLVLLTGRGAYPAWAAPAPGVLGTLRGRHSAQHLPGSTYAADRSIGIGDLPGSDSGVAAYHVRRGLELREEGRLPADDGLVTTTWHRPQLAVLAALLVAALAAGVLAR